MSSYTHPSLPNIERPIMHSLHKRALSHAPCVSFSRSLRTSDPTSSCFVQGKEGSEGKYERSFLWFYVVEGAQNDRVARCLEFVNICGVCSSTAIFGYRNVVHLNVKCTFRKKKNQCFVFSSFSMARVPPALTHAHCPILMATSIEPRVFVRDTRYHNTMRGRSFTRPSAFDLLSALLIALRNNFTPNTFAPETCD